METELKTHVYNDNKSEYFEVFCDACQNVSMLNQRHVRTKIVGTKEHQAEKAEQHPEAELLFKNYSLSLFMLLSKTNLKYPKNVQKRSVSGLMRLYD